MSVSLQFSIFANTVDGEVLQKCVIKATVTALFGSRQTLNLHVKVILLAPGFILCEWWNFVPIDNWLTIFKNVEF